MTKKLLDWWPSRNTHKEAEHDIHIHTTQLLSHLEDNTTDDKKAHFLSVDQIPNCTTAMSAGVAGLMFHRCKQKVLNFKFNFGLRSKPSQLFNDYPGFDGLFVSGEQPSWTFQ